MFSHITFCSAISKYHVSSVISLIQASKIDSPSSIHHPQKMVRSDHL